MNRTFSAMAVLTAVSCLSACSGNSSSSGGNVATSRYVNGYIGASNIHNALLTAVPIDSSGQPQTEFNDQRQEIFVGASATSTSAAYYRVQVDADEINHPLTLIVQGKDNDATSSRCQLVDGCSSGWNYGDDAPVDNESGFEMRASVGQVLDNMRINVNWITHLASALAYTSYIDRDGTEGENPTTPRAGIYTRFTIERANLWLNRMFGVADIISSQPLEPYDLRNDSNLSAAALPDAIYYGALVAGAQQLAREQGVSETVWLQSLIDEFLTRQGQLFQKGGSGTSLYAIFAAAHKVLSENKTWLQSLGYQLPSQIDAVLSRLSDQMSPLEDGELTRVEVREDEVDAWNNVVGNASLFVEDLNERLLNWDASAPDTCVNDEADSDQSCVHSFVDPAYVGKTIAYYDNLNRIYRDITPGLNAITQRLRDAGLAFIKCLNNHQDCAADSAFNSADKTYAVNADGTFRLLVAGVTADGAENNEDGFYAFDIFLPSDELVVSYLDNEGFSQQLTVEFASVISADNMGEPEESVPYMRLVYDRQYDTVPLSAVADSATDTLPVDEDYVQPAGFSFSFPYFRIPVDTDDDGVNEQTGEFYFDATLVGVRDVLTLAAGGSSPYHYNLSRVGLRVLALGPDEGRLEENEGVVTLGDQSEFTLNAEATNAGNYYSDSLWPEADDYFRVREGFDAGMVEPDLFAYKVEKDEQVLFSTGADNTPVYRNADYLEIEVAGFGINRIEIFADDAVSTAGIRNCSVIENGSVRETQACTRVSVTDKKITLESLINDDLLRLFSVPSRGAYAPLFNTDADGDVILAAEGVEETLDGELKAVFAQGLANVDLRMAHELVECENNAACLDGVVADFKRLPLAIVDINLVRESKDEWEVGITAGYDYDYLVDVLPTGQRAQSLYLAYAVGTADGVGENGGAVTYGYELSDLIVFRGGVTLLGNSNGESIGMVFSGDAEYQTGGTDSPCGVINRKEMGVTACEAAGYLTFRNSLIGVVREERDGVYVVRFVDGRFVILGPTS